jgi:hypothetical protein
LLEPDAYTHNTFWILPLFEVLRDTRQFEAFRIKHKVSETQVILSGFKLLLRVIFESYLYDLECDTFLRLSSDKKTDRAFFKGVPPEKIPPTSEKANCIKNLHAMMQQVHRSKDFDSLGIGLERIRVRFISPLADVFEKNVVVDAKLSRRIGKNELLRYVAMFKLWVHAHAIDRLVPLRLFFPELLKDPKVISRRKRLDYILPGYKLGLAFLWYSFPGNRMDAPVHRIVSSKDWEELFSVCNGMREDIRRLESDVGIQFGLTKFFATRGNPQKTKFLPLIRRSSSPKLELNEWIDQALLWHQVEIIDSASSKIFSGSSTFTSLLYGEILARRKAGVRKKLDIIRFRHPGEPVFYSYGLLMERFGSISDFSGWLIFTDVGGEYTGLGGNEYLQAEKALRDRSRYVNVSELEIDMKSLREFFLFKIGQELSLLGSPSPTDIMRFRVDDLEKLLAASRGRLLEFVTKLHYEQDFERVQINFDDPSVFPRHNEIDVFAVSQSKGELVVVECSTQVPINRIDDLIDEMKTKAQCLKRSEKYGSFARYTKVFVTTKGSILGLPHRNQILAKLRKAGIKVMSVEDDIIPYLPKRSRKKELLDILSARPSTQYMVSD